VIEVLYIAGAGRSGSTLLDILLGNHPDVLSVGELAKLVGNGYVDGQPCACGARPAECPLWAEVRQRWLGELPAVALPALAAELAASERIRRWPKLLAAELAEDPTWRAYAEHQRRLLAALLAVSGRRVVVDSSKNPSRALALAAVPGVELRLVHLVRDPRGLAWSYRKPFARDERAGVQHDIAPQAAWRSALGWSLANLQSEWLARRLGPGRSLRVRYEDLVDRPAGVLGRLGRLAQLDLGPVAAALARGEELAVGHVIGGNRLRMAQRVQLRPDREWQERLAARDRRTVTALTWPGLLRYGYPLVPERPA
jgi:hypothetical protein